MSITGIAAHINYKNLMNRENEAVELYNYLSNESDLMRLKEAAYRNAERDMKNEEFCVEYLEANCIYIVNNAARRYVRDYSKGSNWRELFPFNIRRACAMLIANEFVIEKDAGNSWL